MNLGAEVKKQGLLYKLEKIIRIIRGTRTIEPIVVGYVKIERLSVIPNAPSSSRQNACEDRSTHVEEGEDVERRPSADALAKMKPPQEIIFTDSLPIHIQAIYIYRRFAPCRRGRR